MKIIYSNDHQEILVSDEDYPLLSRHNWYIDDGGYAKGYFGNVRVLMHLLICPKERFKTVDHINRNKLDNRRENLRMATPKINNINRSKMSSNTTGYIGVSYIKSRNCYKSNIYHNNKDVYVAQGKPAWELGMLRDYVAYKLRGKLAVLNFPDFDYDSFSHPEKERLDKIVEQLSS